MRLAVATVFACLSIAACSFSSTTVQRPIPAPAPVVTTAPAAQTTTTTTSISLAGD